MIDAEKKVAIQGEIGSNSDMACRQVFADKQCLPCQSFEDAFTAVRDGAANYALLPIDNTVAGRVADIHHLLPDSGLKIIGEYFHPVHHHLLAVRGTKIEQLTHIHSHIHALNQCRKLIRELGVKPMVHADTAGAAAQVAHIGDATQGAIASQLAGEIYQLDSLRANVEDAIHNTTRFLVMSRHALNIGVDDGAMMTSFVFRVRNVPAALYKSLGGFATNGVNMTKLESYLVEGGFVAAQFYVEVEGHPEQRSLSLALEELTFFSEEVRILGTYPQGDFRRDFRDKNGD
ncbi:MAG: prephenate dehydratase [Gammaproteobacteria bacterium]|jgi:prephenate dehydratase